MALDLAGLGTAAADWRTVAGELAKLESDVRGGLVKKSDEARWVGVNAGVTREFIGKSAKEFSDLQREADSIANVLADAHAELTQYQKQAQLLTEDAAKGDPSRNPPDLGLAVLNGADGTVLVTVTVCEPGETDQRTLDRIRWYRDTLNGIIRHAAEVDAAAARALRNSHGSDAQNAGHAHYTSLDEEQFPRAMELASLGKGANPQQRAELHRLWESLSPAARAQLWLARKDELMAAGILSPTMQQVAPDAGAGAYDSESSGFDDWRTKKKMELLIQAADFKGMTDAARHMSHYLGNSGSPMNLPVDTMMGDVPEFQTYVDNIVRENQNAWRTQALEEFRKNGGQPIAFPVEAKAPEGFYFSKDLDANWFYAVGGTNSNVTGVVTVVPDENGNPKVGIDYQANVWDRYNWDKGKGVEIGPLSIPDGDMAELHRAGVAQEFDMSGSSGVRHYELGTAEASNQEPLPGPGESRDGRTNPGREQQQDRPPTTGGGRGTVR
ncbi:hypothetical protein AB0D29_10445 [Streptomyces sp. NPDC048424]|uniref:hypothetical protein n=1 Tax=Streptomyces sp. NPDC048424 TaxID=3155265 RepID=UPI00341F79A6